MNHESVLSLNLCESEYFKKECNSREEKKVCSHLSAQQFFDEI